MEGRQLTRQATRPAHPQATRPEAGPGLELLAWSGCPSHPEALALVRQLLAELGVGETPVEVVWVESDDDADRIGFVGSPSVRVAGRELLEPPPGAPTGLSCRVYRTRDGRFSPLPDPDDLRDALAVAVGR